MSHNIPHKILVRNSKTEVVSLNYKRIGEGDIQINVAVIRKCVGINQIRTWNGMVSHYVQHSEIYIQRLYALGIHGYK